MKHFLACAFIAAASLAATAQEPDSLATYTLNEVVIQAPKVIRKADMDVYHPSKSAVENSKNGMQLLRNLMIPSMTVNETLGTVSAGGHSVQMRINGRTSTLAQVRALLPESIKRVEWIDNLGLLYAGATRVINFIVANPDAGGSLMAGTQQCISQPFGKYNANVKINSGYSQWELGGYYKLTNKIKVYRDYYETFTYPDGSSLTRKETPDGGRLDNTFADATAAYSYIKPDTTVFMAEIGAHSWIKNSETYRGILSLSNGSDHIYLTDKHGDDGKLTPRFSLYLQQHLQNKQMLIVSLNGSFLLGNTYSDYIERLSQAADPITDIHTNIKDRNQAYAIEANYVKNWEKSKLTTGASYTANRNRSTYLDLGGQVFHQRQDKAYFFAEYFHRFGSLTATAGLGLQYTDFKFRESDSGNNSWGVQPNASVTYSLNRNHSLRLNFTSWQNSPSLEETNIVPQQLDGFQWRVGNQNLKTSNSYQLSFQYGFNFPRINGNFNVSAFTSPNAIASLLRWEGDKLITTYENSRGMRYISFSLSPQIEIIPSWLTVSGTLEYRMQQMRGTGYSHSYNSLTGNATVILSHYGFSLIGDYLAGSRTLWGEKITKGESYNQIEVNYNWKNWQFGAGMLMPFGKYDMGFKTLSQWNMNEKSTRINMRIPYISINYNVQWGRQRKSAQKLINANANADASTAGGR